MEAESLLWWHWVVVGGLLLVLDIVLINSYYLLWFGVGAAVVALLLAIAPDTSQWLQLLIFSGVSVGLLVAWLLVGRNWQRARRMSEASNELPGRVGLVVRINQGRGRLRLQRPVAGTDLWEFQTGDQVEAGDSVIIGSVDEVGLVTVGRESRDAEEA